MDPRLSVRFLGKTAKSPLVLASGVMGISYSGMLRAAENGAGVITTKSLSLRPRKGHDGPVVAEYEAGFLNSMGLCNPGVDEGLKETDDFKARCDAPLVVSLFAVNVDEFTALARAVNDSKADCIELNLSCPNVADEFGVPLAASKEKVSEIVSEVKKIARIPVIAKLSPNTYNVPDIARSAELAGADALSLINTLGPGMIIDIRTERPALLHKFGGVSGPAIKPIAIKLVYEISKRVNIPIIGLGGVMNGGDAVEFLLAGASFVGVGSAAYYQGIEVFNKINNALSAYLDGKRRRSIRDIQPI